MISVVIPLFNKEDYIGKTIESVLNQSFSEFEIIIVNDGSTDNSLNIINKYKDNRIRIISIENSGVSVARNTGIKNARFDWVALLDADDWWDSSYLEEVVELIQRNPKYLIFAIGRSRVFGNYSERYSNRFLPEDGNKGLVNYYEVITENFPPLNCSNAIFSKSLFDNTIGFRKGMTVHEDHDFWFRLCVNNPIMFLNKPLSYYRKFETNGLRVRRIFPANDFIVYCKTINEIYDQVSISEKKNIRRYFESFAKIALFQNGSYYTSYERGRIKEEVCTIFNGIYCLKLNLISFLARIGVYKLYETLRYR